MSRLLQNLTVLFCAFQLGCGYILYPERRGQRGGQLDAAIVVLDAVGLLLFIVPGVVAFAVDFSSGTIYLPGGGRRYGAFDPAHPDPRTIEAVVEQETGTRIALRDAEVIPLRSLDGAANP